MGSLDYQKAFDKVPHQKQLHKLKAHGIDGRVSNWLDLQAEDGVIINGEIPNWNLF